MTHTILTDHRVETLKLADGLRRLAVQARDQAAMWSSGKKKDLDASKVWTDQARMLEHAADRLDLAAFGIDPATLARGGVACLDADPATSPVDRIGNAVKATFDRTQVRS